MIRDVLCELSHVTTTLTVMLCKFPFCQKARPVVFLSDVLCLLSLQSEVGLFKLCQQPDSMTYHSTPLHNIQREGL